MRWPPRDTLTMSPYCKQRWVELELPECPETEDATHWSILTRFLQV